MIIRETLPDGRDHARESLVTHTVHSDVTVESQGRVADGRNQFDFSSIPNIGNEAFDEFASDFDAGEAVVGLEILGRGCARGAAGAAAVGRALCGSDVVQGLGCSHHVVVTIILVLVVVVVVLVVVSVVVHRWRWCRFGGLWRWWCHRSRRQSHLLTFRRRQLFDLRLRHLPAMFVDTCRRNMLGISNYFDDLLRSWCRSGSGSGRFRVELLFALVLFLAKHSHGDGSRQFWRLMLRLRVLVSLANASLDSSGGSGIGRQIYNKIGC